MKLENKIILEIIRDGENNDSLLAKHLNCRFGKEEVLGTLFLNRIAGYAYYKLKQFNANESLGRDFMNSLNAYVQYGISANKKYKKNLRLLSEALQGIHCPYAILKGGILYDRFPPGVRVSNDIDVLVSEEDIDVFSSALESKGFSQGYLKNGVFEEASRAEIIYSKMNKGETVPFVKRLSSQKNDYLEIDLNFSLDSTPQSAQTAKRMLSDTAKMENGLLTLSPADFFIHLCAHLYKEATSIFWVSKGRDLGLYKFLDICYILKKISFKEKENIINRVQELKTEHAFSYAVQCTNIIFGTSFFSEFGLETKEDISFPLKTVFASDKTEYRYNVPFLDWLFLKNRENVLTRSKQ